MSELAFEGVDLVAEARIVHTAVTRKMTGRQNVEHFLAFLGAEASSTWTCHRLSRSNSVERGLAPQRDCIEAG
ncbi:MAG TPA: hypothetical protein VHU88_09740 [Sporichthyaceae bacterium]|nr:hypothetical protein [Sporichthyaceae bacterium]